MPAFYFAAIGAAVRTQDHIVSGHVIPSSFTSLCDMVSSMVYWKSLDLARSAQRYLIILGGGAQKDNWGERFAEGYHDTVAGHNGSI